MNPEDCETSSSPIKEICNGAEQSSHVLGLKWDHVKDTLLVSRGVDRPLDKAITQRSVLNFVSSVFDPVGLVAPYTVRARLLLKDIWKISGQSWDDELPQNMRYNFLEWHSGLRLLGRLTIPRCYFTEPVDQIELHMFGDSSQDVFCAVGFLEALTGLEALTPNHFLLGQHATSFPSLLPGEHFDHKKRYVRAQSYANAIWSRWYREHVPSLNKRVKWHTHSDCILKTGDPV